MHDQALIDWFIQEARPDGAPPSDAGHWMAARAPGDIYLALHAAGIIAHPFVDNNEIACAWVADRAWWWRTAFTAAPQAAFERVELVFAGLDTFATIWLNGHQLAATDNMFREYRLDIGALLRPSGLNELFVLFRPTTDAVAGKGMATWPIIADPITSSKRNFVRKAQFGWGWDWAPRLPTLGIWRDVRLERHRIARISDVACKTMSIGPQSRIAVTVEIDRFADTPIRLNIALRAPDGALVATHDTASPGRVELCLTDPALWWVPELGDPALHALAVTLFVADAVLDSYETKIGIRTITLDQSADPDEPGCQFFRFILNGVKLFARGANWVPASSFVGAITPGQFRDLAGRMASANMNMVRVWGGGIYESDAFYDACDELGLLVWQDFMFACAPYPEDDPAFVATVQAEIAYQIRRLRSRACLGLWCGNNEGDAVQAFMNRLTGTATPFSGDLYIHGIIPKTLAKLDPATPYWPGSPGGGPSHNSMRAGDVHNWTVWHGLPPTPDEAPVGGFDHSPAGVAYTRYAEDMCRFVSEFGIQAAPAMSTLQRVLAPTDLVLSSAGFLNRIKDRPQDKVDAMLISSTGLPRNLDEYVRYTQLVQAEGLKFGIEHYRRRKPHCSGALLWQFNDCWPGISWSLIDYDGVAKPSWYAVRRAFAPAMASLAIAADGTVACWVINDTCIPIEFTATVTLATLSGEVIWCEKLSGTAPGSSSAIVQTFAVEASPDRVLALRSPQFPDNRLLFAPVKDLPLAERPFSWSVETGGNTSRLYIEATEYCYGIEVLAADAGARFSDNFFDLMAGEGRTVEVSCLDGVWVRGVWQG